MADPKGVAGRPPDQLLLAELAGMLERLDPPPAWLQDLARLSYDLRSVDLEVAELVADSEVDRAAVAVRSGTGPAEPRLLTFEAGDLLVDLQVASGARSLELSGQLVPGTSATIELRQPGAGGRSVAADLLGRFSADRLLRGPLGLVVRREQGAALALPWVSLG